MTCFICSFDATRASLEPEYLFHIIHAYNCRAICRNRTVYLALSALHHLPHPILLALIFALERARLPFSSCSSSPRDPTRRKRRMEQDAPPYEQAVHAIYVVFKGPVPYTTSLASIVLPADLSRLKQQCGEALPHAGKPLCPSKPPLSPKRSNSENCEVDQTLRPNDAS